MELFDATDGRLDFGGLQPPRIVPGNSMSVKRASLAMTDSHKDKRAALSEAWRARCITP